MSKAKFDAARELIQEKNYPAARAVLQTINHPQAQQWLAKLDDIAPASSPRRPTGRIPWIISGVAIMVAIMSLVVTFSGGIPAASTPAQTDAASIQHLFDAYCAFPSVPKEICSTDPPVDLLRDERVQKCFVASAEGQSVELFINCMVVSSLGLSINGTPVFR